MEINNPNQVAQSLPIFQPCTPYAYARSFLEFAQDALKHVKTQDDALWLKQEIKHIKFILNHNSGEMSHTLSRHIPTIAEQIITSVMRKCNDKLRSADQLGFSSMVGADIIPLPGSSETEITAAEIKVVSFGLSQETTRHGVPYSASVSNVENKFTTIIILMIDPNFEGKPYRIRVVGVDEYQTKKLDCRFGDVDVSRNIKFHNPTNVVFPGQPVELCDLANPDHEVQNKFYEFNLTKMVKMLSAGLVAKNQLQYWNDLFQIIVDRSKNSQTAPLPKYYTKTFSNSQWIKSQNKTLVATRNGHRSKNNPI